MAHQQMLAQIKWSNPEQEVQKPLKNDGLVAIKKRVDGDAVQLTPHLHAISPPRNVSRAVSVIELAFNPAGKR